MSGVIGVPLPKPKFPRARSAFRFKKEDPNAHRRFMLNFPKPNLACKSLNDPYRCQIQEQLNHTWRSEAAQISKKCTAERNQKRRVKQDQDRWETKELDVLFKKFDRECRQLATHRTGTVKEEGDYRKWLADVPKEKNLARELLQRRWDSEHEARRSVMVARERAEQEAKEEQAWREEQKQHNERAQTLAANLHRKKVAADRLANRVAAKYKRDEEAAWEMALDGYILQQRKAKAVLIDTQTQSKREHRILKTTNGFRETWRNNMRKGLPSSSFKPFVAPCSPIKSLDEQIL